MRTCRCRPSHNEAFVTAHDQQGIDGFRSDFVDGPCDESDRAVGFDRAAFRGKDLNVVIGLAVFVIARAKHRRRPGDIERLATRKAQYCDGAGLFHLADFSLRLSFTPRHPVAKIFSNKEDFYVAH